jgi:hypothetical protein
MTIKEESFDPFILATLKTESNITPTHISCSPNITDIFI